MLRTYLESIRFRDWWNYIVPPVIGFYLWGLYQAKMAFMPALLQTAGFLLLTFSVAAFGFFLNEWTDIRDDQLAGKNNKVAALPVRGRILIFALLLLQISAGIYLSVYSMHAAILLGIQLALLVLYSCPPFRLKKNLYLAPLFDALYSGTIFYLLAINVSYSTFLQLPLSRKIALSMLFTWALARGFRNIIIHFLDDIKYDLAIAQKTIGTHYDLSKINFFLKWVLLPAEIASFSIFAFIEKDACGMVLGIFYLLFIFYWLNRQQYIIPFLIRRKTPLPAPTYDINLFHEVLLPVIMCVLLLLSIDKMHALFLLFIFAAFPEIRKWFKSILLFPVAIFKS